MQLHEYPQTKTTTPQTACNCGYCLMSDAVQSPHVVSLAALAEIIGGRRSVGRMNLGRI
jgi:hypothetical protein